MTGRILGAAVALGVCVFFGFWAFVYEGYQEDAGSGTVTSWPWGAVLYGAAVLIGLWIVRLRRPDLSGRQLSWLGLIFALIALLAAFLSLEAGQGSPIAAIRS
jgi:hypothetical protein